MENEEEVHGSYTEGRGEGRTGDSDNTNSSSGDSISRGGEGGEEPTGINESESRVGNEIGGDNSLFTELEGGNDSREVTDDRNYRFGGGGDSDNSGRGESAFRRTRRRRGRGTQKTASSEEMVPGESVEEKEEEEEEEIPDFVKNLGLDEETPSRRGRGGPRASTVYGAAWKAFFKVPALAGYGAFWELSKEEIREIGEATDLLLKSLPVKERTKIIKQLTKYIPVLSFSSTLFMITYPRIQMTQEMRKHVQQRESSSEGNASRAREDDQQPGGNPYTIPTWEQFK